jgi:hypothetical protein
LEKLAPSFATNLGQAEELAAWLVAAVDGAVPGELDRVHFFSCIS